MIQESLLQNGASILKELGKFTMQVGVSSVAFLVVLYFYVTQTGQAINSQYGSISTKLDVNNHFSWALCNNVAEGISDPERRVRAMERCPPPISKISGEQSYMYRVPSDAVAYNETPIIRTAVEPINSSESISSMGPPSSRSTQYVWREFSGQSSASVSSSSSSMPDFSPPPPSSSSVDQSSSSEDPSGVVDRIIGAVETIDVIHISPLLK